MPNATSARRTRPVDASSAPAASRLGPMRMRALRQLNRVVQPLARRCYFMPQPKKRSLIGTIHQECGARVTRQGGSRAICSSRRRVVVGPADRGDGCGSGCAMHRNAARPSLAYVRSRTQVVARRRSWFRSRPICSSHIVGRADRGDGYGSGCVMHRNAAQPSLACVCSRTQVVSRRRSWFRAAAAAAEANRSCSKGAARPAHGRAMVDVGRVRDVGRGRPRPLSCRARARIALRAAPGAGTTTGADGTGTRKARAVW
jgi:hypothetical protein